MLKRGRDMDEEEEQTPAQEEPEKEEAKQEIPAQQNSEEQKPQVVDLDANKEENETEGSVANASVNPTEPIATTTTPSATPSFLEMKRKQRAEKAERERMEMEAGSCRIGARGHGYLCGYGRREGYQQHGEQRRGAQYAYQPEEPFTKYKYPTLNLLKKYDDQEVSIDEEEQNKQEPHHRSAQQLWRADKDHPATVGPTITLYEIQPAEGVRISKIKNLEDDIALSLSALGIRIIAPIPGKGTIGIEVPNAKAHIVSMRAS